MAQGGEDDYVDVALTLKFTTETNAQLVSIIVTNHGARAAYDVEALVSIVYPEDTSYFHVESTVPVGSASLEDTPPTGTRGADRGGGYSFRWTIPELGGLERVGTTARLYDKVFDTTQTPIVEIADKSAYPHEFFGEVTTSSFESDLHKGNNADRIWRTASNTKPRSYVQATGNYSIESISVDEHNPSPGDIVHFTITVEVGSNIDSKVAIELTDGLAVDEDPSASPPREITYEILTGDMMQTPPTYSDGVVTVGTRPVDDRIGSFSATLPIRVSSSAVVNEQCLTATVTGNPPPGVGPFNDDISDNVAKLCLGDQSGEPTVTGEIEMFTVYDCFARQTHPCDGTDGVRVRAVNKNVGSRTIIAPGTTIVQVKDPVARTYDNYVRNNKQQSVTDANTVSWQTASDPHANFTGIRRGVKIFFSRVSFDGQLDNWFKVAGEHVTVKGLDGGNPPGDMYIRASRGSAITRMSSSNSWTATYSGTSSKNHQIKPSLWFAEFSKLGTYVVDYTTIGNRDNTNGDCASKYLPSGVTAAYCDTETYTFHVGPIADLELLDGGVRPEAQGRGFRLHHYRGQQRPRPCRERQGQGGVARGRHLRPRHRQRGNL